MKYFTAIIAFLFITNFALSQKPLVDSLQNLLQQKIPDTTRAKSMISLAQFTEPLDKKQAHKLYDEALKFALDHKFNFYAGRSLRYEGSLYYTESNFEKQHENILRAISFLEKEQTLPVHQKELGQAYNELGTYYRSQDRYDTAVQYMLKGTSMMESSGVADMMISYINLGMVYQQLKMPERQDEYTAKALAAAKKKGKPKDLFVGYLFRTQYWIEVEKFDVAKAYLDSARPYFSVEYIFPTVQSYYTLSGVTYQQLKQYDSAIYYYNKGYDWAKINESPWNMVEPKIQIGHIYNLQQKFREAEAVTLEAVKMAEEGKYQGFMAEAYSLLGNIYASMGSYKLANEFNLKYTGIKDSIEANDRKKFILDLEKKYETAKKDDQLKLQQAELHQKKVFNYILAGSAIALLLISGLLYRNYRHKQKLQEQRINKLETEQQLTATEAVLKGEEQERSRLAKDLHDGLGGMLSGIKYSLNTMKGNLVMTPNNAQAFERSIDMLDSSIKEMRRVAHNMMPEALVKFGLDVALQDFCKDINQSGALHINYQSIGLQHATLDELTTVNAYRIVQELVNNVIRHASAKTALVQVTKTNDIISITVEDDGKGFDTSIVRENKGIGWVNIRNRVDFLKGKLDVQSSPGQGTSVLIEFGS